MGKVYKRSNCITKNLESLLLEDELLDFAVEVEDVKVRCHRVVMAASSDFFRALLRCEMRGANDGCVTLNGISEPTFQHILKSIYSGTVILTLDNFIDVWKAVDQLQIEFMIADCETFALKVMSEDNLVNIWTLADKLQKQEIITKCEEFALNVFIKNFEHIFKTAKTVESRKVMDACKSFMLKNFDGVSRMVSIMELPFEEFLRLIESRDLNMSSEDTVLETVIKWVKYVPENDVEFAVLKMSLSDFQFEKGNDQSTEEKLVEDSGDSYHGVSDCVELPIDESHNLLEVGNRIQLLATLLKSVRTSLVSTPILDYCLKHKLMLDNTEARDILIN
ncbi:kelch repeat and BTB domain-containing protein 3-like [Physella acuta]|uniref:kelch repeat and BTB domain-containing protein 3-like n=1 Tax=Physella acuta TaxID=109671 RepID=UPI0027DC4960|nr:kelch repeat and BTB domain-containing protein 3-like [Physella acuta]